MSTELIPAQTRDGLVPVTMTAGMAMLFDEAMFVRAQTIAKLYANCSMVPDHFKGKMENCFIALQIAVRTGQDPFQLMQQMYIVHGRPGFYAAYTIGQLNCSGKIKGHIEYSFSGEPATLDYGCTAWCIDARTNERIEGPKIDWKLVRAEGWDKPKGGRDGKPSQPSKWMTMPALMFRYRAAAWLIRTVFPEVLMGLQTREELEDAPEPVEIRSRAAASSVIPVGEIPLTEEEKTEPPFDPPVADEPAQPEKYPNLEQLDAAARARTSQIVAGENARRAKEGLAPVDGLPPIVQLAVEDGHVVAADPLKVPVDQLAPPADKPKPAEADIVQKYKDKIEGCTSAKEANKLVTEAKNDLNLLNYCRPEVVQYVRDRCEGNQTAWRQRKAAGPS